MIRVTHIPLAQRKAICGRLAYLATTQPRKLSFSVAGAESEFDQLRDNLFRLTDQAISNSPNSVPLDSFLAHLAANLKNQAQPQLEGPYRAIFQPMVDQAADELKSISCNRCSPIPNRVCDGSYSDDNIVSQSGACIAPIRAMFEIALKAAVEWYSKCASSFESAGTTEVVLSTSFTSSKPHDIPGEYFVGGETKPNDTGLYSFVEVNLCFWPQRFDWNTYTATLYVLFHECICHAFEPRLFSGTGNGEASDAFAEGWMDWIAFECFRKTLENSPAISSGGAYLEAGTQLHLLRVDYNRRDRSEFSFIRAFGKNVAQKLLYLLERLPESAQDPWSKLLMISFDLNLTGGLTDAEVGIWDSALASKGELDPPYRFAQAAQIVIKYMKSKDVAEFREGTHQL